MSIFGEKINYELIINIILNFFVHENSMYIFIYIIINYLINWWIFSHQKWENRCRQIVFPFLAPFLFFSVPLLFFTHIQILLFSSSWFHLSLTKFNVYSTRGVRKGTEGLCLQVPSQWGKSPIFLDSIYGMEYV